MSSALILIFIPTFLFVSLTPGMCMILALTLGMSIGVRRAMYMMLGELIGVAVVACSAALGVAALVLEFPQAFTLLKLAGASYLAWLGYQMWWSKGKLIISEDRHPSAERAAMQLAINGFVTAIANPKGWAFFVTLLPTFLVADQPLAPQLSVMVIIILTIEFLALMLYATGGKTLRHLLLNKNNVKLLNRISGTLMMVVAAWLAVS